MRTVDVSVVLPYRDVADTIGEAIESVLAERDVSFELIAIDDGSRDGSRNALDAAVRSDPRVRMLSSGGRGIAAALNLGVAHARAPLIARMDGDDVSLPGRLGAQLAHMRSMTTAAVGTQVVAFPDDRVEDGLRRYVDWQNSLRTADDHAREVFIEAPLCHPSTMLRKDVLDAIGGYRDGAFPEDYDLWLRLALAGHAMAKIDRVGLRWRHRAGRLTFTDARYSVENIRALKAEHLGARLKRESRELVIWGAGPFGRRLARALDRHAIRATRFIDVDPDKIGRTARGVPITSAHGLHADRHFVVFAVGALGARALVREALADAGFVETRDFLCAA